MIKGRGKMKFNGVQATIFTLVLFLSSTFTGIWLISVSGGIIMNIAKYVHGILSILTLISWIAVIYRRDLLPPA